MKKLLIAVFVGVLAVGSVAVFAQEKVELRMAWWGSQNRHDRTIKVIELFQQKYPHITISCYAGQLTPAPSLWKREGEHAASPPRVFFPPLSCGERGQGVSGA